MARPVLTRFDVFLLKPKSPPGDVTQVSAPGAMVEFYRQGATGVTGATQVSVTKPSGTANVVITAGTRLFVVSDRPKVFQDPLGTVSIGSAVQGDALGRAAAYVSERRFDYVVAEGYFGITSTATVSNSTALSWFHGDSGGTGKYAIIGVSWTGQTGTGNPPLVTYGGTAMNLIASMAACAVYGLATPPPNSQVVAAFDDMVAAVGGGVTVIGADLASSPKWGTNYGASNDGSLTIASPYLWGLLVDCLSLPQLPLGSPITPIPVNGQQQRWSQGVDLPDFFQVRGAASTKLGPAGAISGTSWESLGNNEWNLAGVELRRRVISSHIDVIGGTVPSPAWLNARDFARLRDAVNALPKCGGEVFLSSGSHIVQGETLVIDKPNVTLRGEGKETSTIIGLTPAGGQNPQFDVIRATQPNFRLVDLRVNGNATLVSAYSAVVLSGPDAGDCILKNVQLTQAGYAGLLLDATPSLLAVQVEFLANLGCGVDAAAGTSAFKRIRLIGCWSSQNLLSGIRLSANSDDPGDVLILGCGFESNLEGAAIDGNALGIYSLGGVRVIACSFEWNPGPEVSLVPEQFIYANNVKGLHVEGCLLVGRGGTATTNVKRAIHCQACSQVAFVNNGGFALGSELATFAACTDVVEYANWDGTPGPPPRISGDNGFGLSRASVSLPRYAGALLLPASPGRGALAWDDAVGALRLFDGSVWRTVVYA